MSQSDLSSSFLGFLNVRVYDTLAMRSDEIDTEAAVQVKPNIAQILRSRRIRIIVVATLAVFTVAILFYGPRRRLNLDYICSPLSTPPLSPQHTLPADTDWSRYAYVQYVTNSDYLCNSVMVFEILHRLGSKADRLMMYPSRIDITSNGFEGRLLQKAKNEYGAKLMPIEVQHRAGGDSTWADSYTKLLAFNQTQYDRVLSLDSDSTILQHMDELFLLPPCPVAMPRAYWLNKPYLSSQLVLIQPSVNEFARVKNAIDTAKGGDFDMEIMNDLYGQDCMIIPHRRYDLLTGEFRSKGPHKSYLGNEYERWDPEEVFNDAKFLHFSDWPVPKPWLPASTNVLENNQPKCDTDSDGKEDCRARDMWLRFYADFKQRRKNICDIDVHKLKSRSNELPERRAHEFVPEFA